MAEREQGEMKVARKNSGSVNPHWSKINEKGAVLGIRFLFLVYKYLGRWPFYIAFSPVILYFFVVNREARRASNEYLIKLKKAGVFADNRFILWKSFRQFFNFGCSMLDKLAVWSGRITLDDLDFHGYGEFDQLNGAGVGCLIVGSHLGNIEVCRALAKFKGKLKINVLVHTRHAQKFNSVMREVCGESDVNLIQVTEVDPATAMFLNEKIQRGEHIVIAGDRTPISGRNACIAHFFNEPAPFANGPWILASLFKCPVFAMFCLKTGKRYGLFMEKLFETVELPRKKRQSLLPDYIQVYAQILEKYCRHSPLQWYNFFSFWNNDSGNLIND